MRVSPHFNGHKVLTVAGLVGIGSILFVGSFFLSVYISGNDTAQELVRQFGYIGVAFIALVAGLNAVIPLPPGVFAPIFSAAGLIVPGIILALIVGTTLADIIGYFFGRMGTVFIQSHYPQTFTAIKKLNAGKTTGLLIFVFIYAAFAPFPNEAFIIPLAILGVPLRRFIIPMVSGTIVYHCLTVYGVENIFNYFL